MRLCGGSLIYEWMPVKTDNQYIAGLHASTDPGRDAFWAAQPTRFVQDNEVRKALLGVSSAQLYDIALIAAAIALECRRR